MSPARSRSWRSPRATTGSRRSIRGSRWSAWACRRTETASPRRRRFASSRHSAARTGPAAGEGRLWTSWPSTCTRATKDLDEKTHFRWPNVGPADLNRLKQAVWDAFQGTAQPTFAEAGGGGVSGQTQLRALRFDLAEVAIQVGILQSLASEYTYSENVPVADEARQAKAYPSLLRYFACDPAVADVLLSCSSTSRISAGTRAASCASTARGARRSIPCAGQSRSSATVQCGGSGGTPST